MFPCMNHDLRELGPVPSIGLVLEPSGLRILLGSTVTSSDSLSTRASVASMDCE